MPAEESRNEACRRLLFPDPLLPEEEQAGRNVAGVEVARKEADRTVLPAYAPERPYHPNRAAVFV